MSLVASDKAERKKALILSLGGQTQPLVVSITHHQPDFVVFLASQQSVGKITEVWKGVNGKRPASHVLVDNINDLEDCYQKALQCLKKAIDGGASPDMITVDYTGGTKNMSVALALATIRSGCRYSYVGDAGGYGAGRTNDGMGVVMDQHEHLTISENPWELFNIERRQDFARFFNHHLFTAASDIAERLQQYGKTAAEREVFTGLFTMSEGYEAWDRFEHSKAMTSLQKGLHILERTGLEKESGLLLAPLLKHVRSNLKSLSDITHEKVDGLNLMSRHHVTDLIANAQRRALQGRYDDGVLRLYRALEMLGQIAFAACFNCQTNAVDIDRLSEKIATSDLKQLMKIHGGEDVIKFPMQKTFEALYLAGDPLGNTFFQRINKIKNLQRSRNDSILAHGVNPLGSSMYEALKQVVLDLVFEYESLEFPQITW